MSFWNQKAAAQIGQKGVKYGLQKKNEDVAPRRPKLSMFGDDDDEPDGTDINASLKAQRGVKLSDNKYKSIHESALASDPNVYDYDSFHDGYQESRKEAEIQKHKEENSGPKYIFALLEAQKNRDREQNITYERTLAKGRAADDALHGDKEVFVTAAYKKKLQEEKLWQEQQDARDRADEKNSAFKRGNMDGFLNILTSALAPAPAPEKAADTSQKLPSTPEDTKSAVKSKTLEADINRRAEHELQKRLADMDKYELVRYHAEQRLINQSVDMIRSDGAGVAPDGDGGECNVDSKVEKMDAVVVPDAPVKRKADAETISAAKQRFLDRKRAKQGS